MKQILMRLRVSALVLTLAFVMALAVFPLRILAEPETDARDRYRLDLEILLEEQAAHVTLTLDYTNRTGAALDRVMFNLYANALRRRETIPIETGDVQAAYPSGFAPGGVEFVRVQVDGKDADWAVQGDGELFVRVACALDPLESAQFQFEYYLLLPIYSGALGVGDLTWRLVGFYPVATVYDAERQEFALEVYTAMNEPLFSDAADYDVSLSLPETWAVAAPGTITRDMRDDDTVSYTIHAENLREMALVLSRKMFEKSAVSPLGTPVRALGNTPAAAQALLDCALDAVDAFSDWLGAYPYEQLTLIETEYLYGGLSTSGLIQVSSDVIASRAELPQKVVNLVAHQWFAGIVLSNRNEKPFLTEALSAYATLLYYEEKNGYDDYLRRLNRQVLPALNVTIPGGISVDSEADRFTSRMEYEIVIVDRGVAALHETRRGMGREALMDSLRAYVQQNWLRNVDFSALQSALDAGGGEWGEYLQLQMWDIDEYVGMGLEWYE